MAKFTDLPGDVRLSLLRGYVEGAWKYAPQQPEDYPDIVEAPVTDQVAYDLGRELRQAAQMVWSADGWGDYQRDCQSYCRAAVAINETYGDGIAILMDDEDRVGDSLGLRGFRVVRVSRSIITRGEARHGIEVHHSVEVVDHLRLAQEADERDLRPLDDGPT